MHNSLTCKECGGGIAVAYKRVHEPIGDTGLEKECRVPESSKDIEILEKIAPRNPPIGYRMAYQWGTVRKNERDVPCVWFFMEKISSGTPAASNLDGKTKAELIETAVMAGLTAADETWSKAKLIAEIQKAGQKAEARG